MKLKRWLSLAMAGMLILTGCANNAGTSSDKASEQASGAEAENAVYTAGTYTGVGKGFGGDISVEVVLSDSKIEEVKITDHSETENIGSVAVDKLPQAIVDAQSPIVDCVSGATFSSIGIMTGVVEALKSAGVDTSGFVVPTSAGEGNTATGENKELSCDIVVIGAGGAGMTAAIEAADAGKKVIILEKSAMVGGNTTRSTGGMNAAETPEQEEVKFEESAGIEKTLKTVEEKYPELSELAATVKAQYDEYVAGGSKGYFDSKELFMLDTLVGGKNLNDKELVDALAENADEGIEWLASIGADLTSVGSFGGASVKRIHRPVNDEGKTISVGSYLVPIFEQTCKDKGVEILMETPAEELIVEDGAVVGVKAKGCTVRAKAVILATGGFGANLEMVTGYKPDLKGFVSTNSPAITGDGIVMAEEVGAVTVDMEQIQIHPTVEQSTSSLITEGLRGDGAILVNAEGKRFIDEVGTRDVVSAAEVAQTGGFAYLIVDQKMVDASSVIAGYIKKGFTVQGDTYEALAKEMQVDEAAFAETMEAWNKAVAAGKDEEFERTSFAEPLDTAPFYAIKVAPGVHHTMGGIKINNKAEVLNKDGSPIPGLFAAGEVTGGVHGANRLGGNAVADIVVFGRIAGDSAVQYAK